MPFTIVRNDIALMKVDAIVNTANPKPIIGAGTDSAIHRAAGPELLAARQKIGNIAPGDAAVTPAFGLDAKYVIHTVGPVWHGGFFGEARKLRSCYEKSLTLAAEQGCSSIAFPLISTGYYGFPKDKALRIAIYVFSEFLLKQDMDVYLVVYDGESYQLSEKLFQGVAGYIDDNYVEDVRVFRKREHRQIQACLPCVREEGLTQEESRFDRVKEMPAMQAQQAMPPQPMSSLPMQAPGEGNANKQMPASLADMLKMADAGFTETLLKLIDSTGKKDSEIYKKANLSKQHFSKIRNDPDYKPKKATALALALALELNLDQTNDLIGRAGFTLSNSSKFDLIIRYFIENRSYNIVEINIALYEFDQPLLGA